MRMDSVAPSGRQALARWAPEPVAALAEVESVAAASVDATTLELVRRRVAALLGATVPATGDAAAPLSAERAAALDDWRGSPLLDDREQALLTFVEQFVFSVSSMGDEEVAALLEHATAEQVHELANVTWAVDLTTRLDLVAAAVLA